MTIKKFPTPDAYSHSSHTGLFQRARARGGQDADERGQERAIRDPTREARPLVTVNQTVPRVSCNFTHCQTWASPGHGMAHGTRSEASFPATVLVWMATSEISLSRENFFSPIFSSRGCLDQLKVVVPSDLLHFPSYFFSSCVYSVTP